VAPNSPTRHRREYWSPADEVPDSKQRLVNIKPQRTTFAMDAAERKTTGGYFRHVEQRIGSCREVEFIGSE